MLYTVAVAAQGHRRSGSAKWLVFRYLSYDTSTHADTIRLARPRAGHAQDVRDRRYRRRRERIGFQGGFLHRRPGLAQTPPCPEIVDVFLPR